MGSWNTSDATDERLPVTVGKGCRSDERNVLFRVSVDQGDGHDSVILPLQ